VRTPPRAGISLLRTAELKETAVLEAYIDRSAPRQPDSGSSQPNRSGHLAAKWLYKHARREKHSSVTLPLPADVRSADGDLARNISAAERLDVCLARLADRRFIRDQDAEASAPDRPEIAQAVHEEFGSAIKSFRACLYLAAAGYGQSALFVASSVMRSSLLVLWAIDQPADTVDRLAELHYKFGLHQDSIRRHTAGLPGGPGPSAELDDDTDKSAREAFGDSSLSLWTGHASIEELAEAIASQSEDAFVREKILGYPAIYDRAFLMGMGTGISQRAQRVLRESKDGTTEQFINIGKGDEYCAFALHTATTPLVNALEVMADRYAPDLVEEVSRCYALLWRAWKRPDQLTNLADTDPCPCDRPNTMWADCHKWTERLGTRQYSPPTDDDIAKFVPVRPAATPTDDSDDAEFPAEPVEMEGSFVYTFTLKLPFTLGVAESEQIDFSVGEQWADPDDVAQFGEYPQVRLRVHNEPTPTRQLWTTTMERALASFYGDLSTVTGPDFELLERPDYEQWISLETSSGRLASEADSNDPNYAFHRCMNALNAFLTALDLISKDARITSVSTRELGGIVFCGVRPIGQPWKPLGSMIMHPDSLPVSLEPNPTDGAVKRAVAGIVRDMLGGRPFLLSNIWFNRALRSLRLRGDYTDCVVSLQTAAESMFFDLMRGILVDRGKPSAEINAKISPELPFKTLFDQISHVLGGNWQRTGAGIVARYWNEVYLLRNRVVHAGHIPSSAEAESALSAFMDVREYVSDRLWQQHAKFPRTLLAKVGENGLERRRWMTRKMKATCGELVAEPRPFYWPHDLADR
jgi:hypothetical protein